MEQNTVDQELLTLRRSLDSLGTIELGPIVSLHDVLAFEQRHHIELPLGFRRFILEVGNGGDGPGYGLTAFDPYADMPRLAAPFPLDRFWRWDDEDEPDPQRVAACQDGWLGLGTEGCGMDWVLVVSGTERGNVWNVEGQGAQPCAPSRTFLSWYLLWLEWTARGGEDSGTEWWDVVWADYAEGRGRPTRA